MAQDCTFTEGSFTCFCPLTGVVDLLGRKYTMQIVCVVGAHEPVRFGDIEAHLPTASTSTLSSRLEELAEAGLVTREQYDEIPPRVEYELTEDGRELCGRLEPLLEWAAARQ
jgi:DNA-binding HxlR family transcriptional regulator